jgi:hypothetical protein
MQITDERKAEIDKELARLASSINATWAEMQEQQRIARNKRLALANAKRKYAAECLKTLRAGWPYFTDKDKKRIVDFLVECSTG